MQAPKKPKKGKPKVEDSKDLMSTDGSKVQSSPKASTHEGKPKGQKTQNAPSKQEAAKGKGTKQSCTPSNQDDLRVVIRSKPPTKATKEAEVLASVVKPKPPGKIPRKTKPKQNYPCNLCDKTYANKQGRWRHVAVEHENRRYECPKCKAPFRRMCDLNKHHKSTGHSGFNYTAAAKERANPKPTRKTSMDRSANHPQEGQDSESEKDEISTPPDSEDEESEISLPQDSEDSKEVTSEEDDDLSSVEYDVDLGKDSDESEKDTDKGTEGSSPGKVIMDKPLDLVSTKQAKRNQDPSPINQSENSVSKHKQNDEAPQELVIPRADNDRSTEAQTDSDHDLAPTIDRLMEQRIADLERERVAKMEDLQCQTEPELLDQLFANFMAEKEACEKRQQAAGPQAPLLLLSPAADSPCKQPSRPQMQKRTTVSPQFPPGPWTGAAEWAKPQDEVNSPQISQKVSLKEPKAPPKVHRMKMPAASQAQSAQKSPIITVQMPLAEWTRWKTWSRENPMSEQEPRPMLAPFKLPTQEPPSSNPKLGTNHNPSMEDQVTTSQKPQEAETYEPPYYPRGTRSRREKQEPFTIKVPYEVVEEKFQARARAKQREAARKATRDQQRGQPKILAPPSSGEAKDIPKPMAGRVTGQVQERIRQVDAEKARGATEALHQWQAKGLALIQRQRELNLGLTIAKEVTTPAQKVNPEPRVAAQNILPGAPLWRAWEELPAQPLDLTCKSHTPSKELGAIEPQKDKRDAANHASSQSRRNPGTHSTKEKDGRSPTQK